LIGLRPDGTADIVAVFRSVIQQPGQLPALVRIALDARIARAALYRGRQMLGAGLGFPRFSDGVADVRTSARGKLNVSVLDRDRALPAQAVAAKVLKTP
jgi:hypothetical protein